VTGEWSELQNKRLHGL